MLPDHILLDKAIDAAHAASPKLDLDALEKAARRKVAEFKALVEPPPVKLAEPAVPLK